MCFILMMQGPAYTVMGKSKAVMAESPLGPFVYAKKGHERTNLKALRAETWRAMEVWVVAEALAFVLVWVCG